ncbi:MAG: hypothetical protein A3C90_03445 [Candidatus Magasanikbacteria bacterium RIFCSPHIGHO2_02_FULL_51_14]|uniref:Uncharacterized protein n=1 Tax=Candidatus Magasanikbacteria bacterium RIFCSPHIGHO2_02_FULL_51_14 TaxID=1798683 RepID=A0A1F6MRU0_9BACT|nr:MAG: hypothetical protein A3C90_03445 [Candidatus Magasanikbacteria bacterium RIFCSPHIGHO2_02_FULL_51_14]
MPKLDTNARNLPGHAARTRQGTLRKIRGDTEMKTLESRYGVDFGVNGSMRWDTYKEKYGVTSVRDALKKAGK